MSDACISVHRRGVHTSAGRDSACCSSASWFIARVCSSAWLSSPSPSTRHARPRPVETRRCPPWCVQTALARRRIGQLSPRTSRLARGHSMLHVCVAAIGEQRTNPQRPGKPGDAESVTGAQANPPGAQCSHCSADTPKLTRAEIDTGLLKLPNWELTDDGAALRRAFTAKNWAAGAPCRSNALVTALNYIEPRKMRAWPWTLGEKSGSCWVRGRGGCSHRVHQRRVGDRGGGQPPP